MNWNNAKNFCIKKKSSLLIVESNMVLDFSIKFFQQNKLTESFYVFLKFF